MILACDVGATKTNVALLTTGESGLTVTRLETYGSRQHASLTEIIAHFLGDNPPALAAAGLGIAGPVVDNRVVTTNLPWVVDGAELGRQLKLPQVSLLNDVEVIAWGVPDLSPAASMPVQSGHAGAGTIAVIAAGSGLGMSALLRGDGPVRALASEGGHVDFAPIDDVEIELLRFLRQRFGRVSAERVLSGPGLVNVYDFLRQASDIVESTPIDTSSASAAMEIGVAALTGQCELAARAVLLFLGVYGAAAGNWALATMATGGVWLGGASRASCLKDRPAPWLTGARAPGAPS